MRSSAAQDLDLEQRLRTVANARRLVAKVAELSEPADVLLFARDLHCLGEVCLAEYALDVASARSGPGDLRSLLECLSADGHGEAFWLTLRTAVRRQPPHALAALLAELDSYGQDSLVAAALGAIADSRCPRDAVHVVLALRSADRGALADRVAVTVSAALTPADLAEFLVRLRDFHDQRSAASAIQPAIEGDTGRLADLIACLSERDWSYGETVVFEASSRYARDAPGSALVLASLLSQRLPDHATSIWARIVPGLEDSSFFEALDHLGRKADQRAVQRALREAAATHSIERVAVLVQEVRAKVEHGDETMLHAVAETRSVTEIHELARRLDRGLYGGLAWRLLDLAIEQVHERPDGDEAAEFIALLNDRVDSRGKRSRPGRPDRSRGLSSEARKVCDRIPDVFSRIVQRRDPAQLMELISGLVERQQYYPEYGLKIRQAVARRYQATDLAALPLVRRADQLPAVLDIMLDALLPVATEEVPAIVEALVRAGAPQPDLISLLAFIGAHRRHDYDMVAGALDRRGQPALAQALRQGFRKPRGRPEFIVR
jgi:hypothetical protein